MRYDVLILYVIPTILCLIGYTIRCYKEYKRDLLREDLEYYMHKLTWGDVVLRLIVSIVPGVNVIALILDILAAPISTILDWLNEKRNIPVVIKTKKVDKI